MPSIGLGWWTRRSAALRALTWSDNVAKANLRHYRQIARSVLRWYSELEDGVIQAEDGPKFDSRILDYRIDVDNCLKKFHPAEVKAVLLVNRDGVTHAQAVAAAGLQSKRPDELIRDIEIKMGQAFARHKLDGFLEYVNFLRG